MSRGTQDRLKAQLYTRQSQLSELRGPRHTALLRVRQARLGVVAAA